MYEIYKKGSEVPKHVKAIGEKYLRFGKHEFVDSLYNWLQNWETQVLDELQPQFQFSYVSYWW